MLSLLLCASAVFAQSSPTNLSLENGGLSVGALLKEVAKQSNSDWRVSPEFEPIIVTVRLNVVPEAEFREKLALSLDGQWKQVEKTWRLEPNPKKVAATRKKNFDRRVSAIRELQRTAREQIKRFESWNETRSDSLIDTIRVHANNIAENRSIGQSVGALVGMLNEIPTGELVYRMLESLDADEVARAIEWRRFVYSTRPTKRQRPVPIGVENSLAKTIDRQKRFAEKASASIVPKGSAAGYVFTLLRSADMAEVDRVRAIVTIPEWSRDVVAINVLGLDRSGKSHWDVGNSFRLSLQEYASIPEPFLSASETVPMEPWTALFVASARPDHLGALPKDLAEKIEAPDKFDPISLVVGDWLVRWSKSRSHNLIAVIPDSAIPIAFRSFAHDMSAKSRFALLSSTADVEWIADGNWLFGKPRDMDAAIRSFTPRKSMGVFMKAMRTGLELDDWIEFVGSLEPASLEKVLFKEFARLYPDVEGLLFNENWEAMKLISLMGPTQRLDLANGRSIPLSSLNPEAKNWHDRALANLELGLAPSSKLVINDRGFDTGGEFWPNVIEPTDWPDSDSRVGSISLSKRSSVGAFISLGSSRSSSFHPASSIGESLADSASSGKNWLGEATSFHAGKNSCFNFEIRFANGISGYWTKRIERRSGSVVGSLDLLPKEIRDAIESERNKRVKPPIDLKYDHRATSFTSR